MAQACWADVLAVLDPPPILLWGSNPCQVLVDFAADLGEDGLWPAWGKRLVDLFLLCFWWSSLWVWAQLSSRAREAGCAVLLLGWCLALFTGPYLGPDGIQPG